MKGITAVDKEAHFKQLLESNQDRVFRICCCYIRDEDERRDVFQNVLLQIWRNLDNFSGKSAITTWIYRITVNVCLGHLRLSQRRMRLFSQEPADGDSSACADACLVSAPHERDDDLRQLYACIQQLPDLDKTLVSLFLEDASTGEMAEVLGISEANVRVKLHRIKQALKQSWAQNEYGSR